MNTLNEGLQEEIEKLWMEHVASRSDVKAAVFISAKSDNFIAGADINMLKAKKAAGEEDSLEAACLGGHALFERLMRAKPIPTVAAIHGACLGGGLEWALKCDARIATTSPVTKLGLPEVKLGLLPGWGGTYALPKLIGVLEALPLILQGTELRADKARRLGLVDYTCDLPSLQNLATATALGLVTSKRPLSKKRSKLIDQAVRWIAPLRNYIFERARKEVMSKTGGKYPAALEIINAVKFGCTAKGPKDAFANEAKAFVRLAKSAESTALIGLFDGLTDAKKYAPARAFSKVCVLGAGLMGAGITQVTAEKKIPVVLKDVNLESVYRGIDYVATNLHKKVQRKRASNYERNTTLSRIAGYSDTHDPAFRRCVSDANVVIEAVLEKLSVKHQVFAELEPMISGECVLATNTSAIPIADVARGCSKPERVVGMHYFSPVPQMQLLEIIPHAGTSAAAIETATALGIKQAKTCIVVKDVPGFYVNRALAPMMAEIGPLFADGVDPMRLDKAILDLGMPVGPCALLDEVGADVALHVQKTMISDTSMGDRMLGADPTMLQTIVERNWLGRKTGKGFFTYGGKGKKKLKEPHAEALDYVKTTLKQRDLELSTAEIQDRFLSRFVNEAAVCLQDSIVTSPVDADLGAVFGIGFLPFTGGPFRMLDTVGTQSYVDKMHRLADTFQSERFLPCQLLVDYAKSNAKFYSS